MGIVIEKNDIEIGGITKFLAAELAIADDGKSGYISMPPPQPRPGKVQYGIEQQVGKIGKMITQGFKGQQSFHIPCQQLKYLGMVEMPQYIHLLFDIGAAGTLRILQLAQQPFPRTRPIERI